MSEEGVICEECGSTPCNDSIEHRVSKSAPAPGLCCRCGAEADGTYGAYEGGKHYPACHICALLLGETIRREILNAQKGTAA